MSLKGAAISSLEAPIFLTPGKNGINGNFYKWSKATNVKMQEKFGRIANVMKTDKPHEIPPLVASDYTPDGDHGLNEAAITAIQVDQTKSRMRRVRDLLEQHPHFYAALLQTLSPESFDLIERHPDYAANELVEDPNVLWRIIKDTHSTNTTGGGKLSLVCNKVTMRAEFDNNCRQGKMSVVEFKEMFTNSWKTLVANGEKAVPEEELAMMFLLRLDMTRYGAMYTEMQNDADKGLPFPTTVHQAYTIAANRKEYKLHTGVANNMNAVFAFADTAGGRGSRGRGRGGRNQPGRGRGPTKGAAGDPVVETPIAEYRTCAICLKKGHMKINCPDNPSNRSQPAVHVVVGNLDSYGSEDEDDFNQKVMVVSDIISAKVFMFGRTQVLLDNQAGLSIMHAEELLHDITPLRRPYNLSGIDGSSAEGLRVDRGGMFRDFSKLGRSIGYSTSASANVLSMGDCVDKGYHVEYDRPHDQFIVHADSISYVFKKVAKHYVADMADYPIVGSVLVQTVSENLTTYSKREIDSSRAARDFQESVLGHFSTVDAINIVNAGIQQCSITAQDILRANAIHGPSIASLKGKTKKQAPTIAGVTLVPRITQIQQTLHVDIFFVKKLPFLLGIVKPLGLVLTAFIGDRSLPTIATTLNKFITRVKSRDFDIQALHSDGEGAIQSMIPELQSQGITIVPAGPGAHVPVAERYIQTIKGRVRSFEHSLPYVMSRTILIYCVLFCANAMNLIIPTTQALQVSPQEQFTGRRLSMATDLRFGFGDYVQATVATTDNSMKTRTEGCIALLSTGSSSGSVRMLHLATDRVVTRDHFKTIPMPDLVTSHITAQALRQGFSRGAIDPAMLPTADHPSGLPTGMTIARPEDGDVSMHSPVDYSVDNAGVTETDIGSIETAIANTVSTAVDVGQADLIRGEIAEALPLHNDPDVADTRDNESDIRGARADVSRSVATRTDASDVRDARADASRSVVTNIRGAIGEGHRYPTRLASGSIPPRGAPPDKLDLLVHQKNEEARRDVRKQLELRSPWRDTEYAFKISVRMAMRDRPEEARPVIMAELQQMVDKRVWHAVHLRDLSHGDRKRIIRSSMFLKDKYLASGAFERFKARLVAGGDMQDKSLYENLSSPTASTTSVLTVAAIAAAEGRSVITIDIGGAFLNADMAPTGVKVHMRLDKVMTTLLQKIDPSNRDYVESGGTMVVELDKALYGCVEAAGLWYEDLRSTIEQDGFVENPYDVCVFNKTCTDGTQTTIVLHVDDLMVSNVHESNLDAFYDHLKEVYKETRVVKGRVLDYVGMTFDFTKTGEVKVTMGNCVNDILGCCENVKETSTPASSALFDVRATTKATAEESAWFHSMTAKVLYLAKRVRPECLTAVAFLSTRVNECDKDDIQKLRRLLGYLKGSRDRGIILRIGENMRVRAYIDAAYGVHQESGKSHTGCAIVIGDGGPVYNKSAKQKIVTKSSTEAELVGLSDTASQAIHMRNFVIAQGYDIGPVIIYQDNMSCMVLMKRGGPCSDRSRHINIRHFWLCEKVTEGEVIIEHLGTESMFANVLTKPVQGAQFIRERGQLTNWM